MRILTLILSVIVFIGIFAHGEATTIMTRAEQRPNIGSIQNFDQDFGLSGTITSSVDNAWATASEGGFLQISASVAGAGGFEYDSGKATASWQDEITNTSAYTIHVNYNFLIDGFLSVAGDNYGEEGHISRSSYELGVQLNGRDFWSSSVFLDSEWIFQLPDNINITEPVITGEDLGGTFSGFTSYSLNNDLRSLSLATLLPGETLHLATTFSLEGLKDEHLIGSTGGFFSLTGGFNSTEVVPSPEPATVLLFFTGITGLAAVGRRKCSLNDFISLKRRYHWRHSIPAAG